MTATKARERLQRPRLNTRPLREPEAFAKARWYLNRGYPAAWIAEKVGVNRNTVYAWAKTLGLTVPNKARGVRGDKRLLNDILRRVQSLSSKSRVFLMNQLQAAA